MELRRADGHYTVEDYEQWEGDFELWHGRAVVMSPSPVERHGELTLELGYQIKLALKQNPACRCRVMNEIDWRVSNVVVVRPDLSIRSDGAPAGKYIDRAPSLIAEVLSPSTEDRDRTVKRDLYLEQGVTHYLMVQQDTGRIEAATLRNGAYVDSQRDGDRITLELHDGCRIALPAILTP